MCDLRVTCSQSAAVPAPAQKMLGAKTWSFSQFLSATMEPAVALVSAASATPPYIKQQHTCKQSIPQ